MRHAAINNGGSSRTWKVKQGLGNLVYVVVYIIRLARGRAAPRCSTQVTIGCYYIVSRRVWGLRDNYHYGYHSGVVLYLPRTEVFPSFGTRDFDRSYLSELQVQGF